MRRKFLLGLGLLFLVIAFLLVFVSYEKEEVLIITSCLLGVVSLCGWLGGNNQFKRITWFMIFMSFVFLTGFLFGRYLLNR